MFYNSRKLDKISIDNDKSLLIELIEKFENEQDKILNLNLIIQNLCKKGNLDLVKFLLSFSKYNIFFNKHIFLFENACLSGNIELVNYLLQLTIIDINELSEKIDSSFHRACQSGNIDLVKLLIELFPNIDISYNNEMPFQNACLSKNINIVKYLLKIKPNIDIFSYNNEAIKNACYCGSIEITNYLLELVKNNKNIVFSKFNIKKLLICAAQSCNLELFKMLLSYNVNNNIDLSFNNETLLITACNSRNNELVKYLLEIKPDIDINTINNIKGKDYCFKFLCAKNNIELIELFYRKDPHLIYKYSHLFIFLEELLNNKTKIIQNWWKKILYNPHNKIGRKFVEKQIEWAF